MAKLKTSPKPLAREQRTYDLEIGNARTWSVSGPALLQLAAPKWSKDYQLANPNQPCTRLVKDVLKVGRWLVGKYETGEPRFWDVTENELHEIAAGFDAATANGNEFNLCWGHGDPVTKRVDARNVIQPIDQVFVQGDTLWATSYVDLATAEDLKKKSRKVSVRVYDNWMDGSGNVYPKALLHVAVVDLPVMASQDQFRDMGRTPSTKGKAAMDFATILDLFTRLFAALGITMPDNVTEDNLTIVVETLIGTIPEETAEETDPNDPTGQATTTTLPAASGAPGGGMSAELSLALKPLADQLKDLSLELKEMKGNKAKDAYTSKLTALATAGKINAKAVASLTTAGAAHGYDLALLSPFDDVQMVDMSRRGKQLATGKAPAVPGTVEEPSEVDRKALQHWRMTGEWPEGYKPKQ